MTETFACEFPGGLRCVIVTQKPRPDQSHNMRQEWQGGRPTPEIFPQFRDWMHTVNQELATKWQRPIKHVFAFSEDKAEVWLYEPNKPPQPSTI